MIDLDKLEALAKAATPGPWTYRDYGHSLYLGDLECKDGSLAADVGPRDAAYFTALPPQTILALIAELRAARAVVHQAGLFEGLDLLQVTLCNSDVRGIIDALDAYDAVIGAGEKT